LGAGSPVRLIFVRGSRIFVGPQHGTFISTSCRLEFSGSSYIFRKFAKPRFNNYGSVTEHVRLRRVAQGNDVTAWNAVLFAPAL